MGYILFALIGYICGSIRFSYFIPKITKKVDVIADSPDHNPGTYNAVKLAGWPVGMMCLGFDISKGLLPVLAASGYCQTDQVAFAFVMAAPVLGHSFPLLNIRQGGKGIATTFGVLLGLFPALWMLGIQVAFYVSLSILRLGDHRRRTQAVYLMSLAASVCCAWLGLVPGAYVIGYLFIAVTVLYKHTAFYEKRRKV